MNQQNKMTGHSSSESDTDASASNTLLNSRKSIPKPSRHRSQPDLSSTSSTNTTTDIIKSTYTYADKMRRKMNTILKDYEKTMSPQLKEKLNTIAGAMRQLTSSAQRDYDTIKELQTRITDQSSQIQELRQDMLSLSEKIPSTTDIQDAVHAAIQTHTTVIEEATKLTKEIIEKVNNVPEYNKMDGLITNLERNTSKLENTTSNIEQIIQTTATEKALPEESPAHTDKTEKPLPTRTRILILKANNIRTTGQDIKTALHTIKTKAVLLNITTRRSSVEILCNSQEEKEKLKEEIEAHEQLTQLASTQDKQKAIIMNTPEDITFEDIHDTIAALYELDKDDITHLRDTKAREENYKNTIVLIAPSLLKGLMTKGSNGTYIRWSEKPFLSYLAEDARSHDTQAKERPIFLDTGS